MEAISFEESSAWNAVALLSCKSLIAKGFYVILFSHIELQSEKGIDTWPHRWRRFNVHPAFESWRLKFGENKMDLEHLFALAAKHCKPRIRHFASPENQALTCHLQVEVRILAQGSSNKPKVLSDGIIN